MPNPTVTVQTQSDQRSRQAIREVNRLVRNSPGTFEWFEANKTTLLRIVAQGFDRTANAAGEYIKALADIADEPVDIFPSEFAAAAAWAAIRATGPAYYAQLLSKGVPQGEARAKMLKLLDGAIYRNVYNGNRNTVLSTVNGNRNIVAYRRRSTTGTPCAFCALMIARGAVYKSQQTAEGHRSSLRYVGKGYHDWDKCSAEPLFRGKWEKTDQEKLFAQIYEDSGGGLKNFRTAYAEYRNNPGG